MFLSFYKTFILIFAKNNSKCIKRKKKNGRQGKWESGRKSEREWWLPSPHPLRLGGRDFAPTSHMEDHPQATHAQWQKFPVPVRGSPVFVCSHTYKPASESSSPHAAPCEQLSHWFTGSNGLEKFPVCPTTEEKNTHTGYSASASITLPLFYWESHLRAACSSDSLKELSC